MENNITAGEKFMGGKVVELVSFLADRATEKNTTFSSRSKFMCGMHFCSICKTIENLKMGVSRDLVVKSFKRGLMRKKSCDTTKRLMSSSKCRSVKVINNPTKPGSNHREIK
jgi:hypothetical protein